MQKFLLSILTLLVPFLGYTQINTFPWTHDFDNGVGITNWTTNDDGDWLLNSGPTPSNNTGPSDDMTGGGNYWYIEASYPNYPDKYFVSQIDTFDISQTPGQILSFWYHMYGSGMGELNIWLGDDNGWNKIDSIIGDQGDEWHIKYIELDSLGMVGDFSIAFEGKTGSGWASDIAIDDIYIGDSYPVGCMDPLALNYDPLATVDDGSCTYAPCGGFVSYNAYQMCWGSQAAIQFEWLGDTTYSQCDVIKVHVGDANGWTMNYGGYWPAQNGWHGHAVGVGNGQMPPNWNVEHYAVLELADGNLSDTIFYTPNPCIEGCTDSTQQSYNPWATQDDGSCSGTTCDPVTEQQITINITLDNWPGETGWELVTNAGPNVQTPSGTYTFNDIGVTYTYTHCVSNTAGFEFIITDTYGDGIMGNGTPGSAGEVVIYDCNGDTITYLSSGTWLDGGGTPVGVNMGGYPNGTVAYSGPQNGVPCAGPPAVPGCTDPAYQEFNPLANVDDSSCTNLHVFGCTDSTAFNYDPTASQMDLVPVCSYILKIEDDAADGWGNSYLGVTQGNNQWTFTMGPGSYSQSFPLNLDSDKPVTVYYFEIPDAQNPDPIQTAFQTFQNSFLLINTYGDTLLSEGTNPFANNGQGALQGFGPPFWTTYSSIPSCGNTCIPVITGCMDSTAFNYNSNVNVDDGSCYYNPGCTSPAYLEFHNQGYVADFDDGSCLTLAEFGCMDSIAFNYNTYATVEWTSATDSTNPCVPTIYGCTDPQAFNFIPLTGNPFVDVNTNDNSCIPVINGCTDSTMYNYNSLANTDNGTCIPFIYGCTDSTALNYDPLANTNDNSCIPILYGCTDSTALNYNALANTDDGSCIAVLYGCTDPTAFNYNSLANTDDGTCIPVITGCMDSTMYNYDSTANTVGTCIPFIYGCTNPIMFNYNTSANTDDGTCVPYSYGCTDPTAFNYDSTANTDNGSCIPIIFGCTDSTAFNYDPLVNTDNGTCVAFIYGCTDATASNYNPLANTLDGSCYYNPGCTDPLYLQFWTQGFTADYDDGSCTDLAVYGCMNPISFNYNPLANIDDGSCIGVVLGCMDDGIVIDYDGDGLPALNYNPLANTEDGSCITKVFGCMDNTMFNYNPLANVDNGSCIPFVYGCMDTTMFNYNPLANTQPANVCVPFIYGCMDDGQGNDFNGDGLPALNYCAPCNTNQVSATDVSDPCIAQIFGCTDSTAFNYDPLANVDNGTCIATVLGCTDGYDFQGYLYTTYPNYIPGFSTVIVSNYNPNANTDDGSCLYYDLNTVTGAGTPYWLNDTCYAWVVYEVDPYCLNNQWDSFCQSQYDYCEHGTPLDLEDMTRDQILVYPNPTRDKINIKSKNEINVDLYDLLGNHIIHQEKAKEVDMMNLPSGVYNLRITFKGMIINHKIIKQ